MADDDQGLVQRVQAGDGAALDELVQRHHAPLVQFLERMLGDAEAAADVCQEAFLRMMRALPRYRPRARFSTWLYTIAANLARDELRRRRLRPAASVEPEDLERATEEAPHPAVADQVLAKLERAAVRAALAQLSADHRAVVILHYYQGFSYQEIAGIVGCTVGTVGSRLHYGIKHLRRYLVDNEVES